MSDNITEVVTTEATVGNGASLMSLLPMVLIFAIFYFFLIRPQVKRQRAIEKMNSELKKGDKVVAAGGIYGSIVKIEDNILTLEISETTKIKVSRSSVTEVLSQANEPVQEKITEAKSEISQKVTKPKTKPTTKPKTKA